MKKISALITVMLCFASAYSQNLIPQPVSVEQKEGSFRLTPDVTVYYLTEEEAPLAEYLAGYLGGKSFQGIANATVSGPGRIRISIRPEAELPDEGYQLRVNPQQIRITGADYGGVFNGIQTLLQLLPAEIYGKPRRDFNWQIECISINDHPRFPYRGMMLDVARTFIPKQELLRHLDLLAYHKINKFHWHLADDEGWRIEIKSYPKLAGIGGFRGGDSPVKPVYGAWDEKYGGYFTQDDVREIVAYAGVRNIEVIPEIDLPGHSRTAALVYPDILCDYTPDLTSTAGYDRRNVWCVSREENYEMLDRIIGELSELFPSGYLHLGGDEVEPGQWSRCPHCRALMEEKGIKEPPGLEDVFMERVVAIAARHGKKTCVWNEASASGKLDRSVTVWGWENVKAARKAAAAGYPTVVLPGKYFYFDMRQSQNEKGHIWAGIVSPRSVYSFDFDREGFTAGEMKNVHGVQATFFSELLLQYGIGFLDYQLYPRICALSELAWTPNDKGSWSDFEMRLNTHYNRMDEMGISYRTAPVAAVAESPRKTPSVTLTSSLKEASRYPFSNVTSYKTMARTAVTCRKGDWFLFEFSSPLTCDSIRIGTGYEHLMRAGVPRGEVEISYDGKSFERAAKLHDLEATIHPAKPVKALRIVSDSDGNGEAFVIIQPLAIR